jgi:hypothetical protein
MKTFQTPFTKGCSLHDLFWEDDSETSFGGAMKLLRHIMGVGGGAIAGTLTAIAVTERPLFVFLAMSVSSIVGGIVPESGVYAALGGFLGLLGSVWLGPDCAVRWWPILRNYLKRVFFCR